MSAADLVKSPKSCIILGSGRSGTSMVAGALASSGNYYMGDTLLEATPGNPRGYFESREVEALNENLIRAAVRSRWLSWWMPNNPPPVFKQDHPRSNSAWLAQMPLDCQMRANSSQISEIQRLTHRQPFCFKDPRFSYTLPVWRPYLQDAVFICVFREPWVTAASILKEVATETYLQGLKYDSSQALAMWGMMYTHILEKHSEQGDWLFLHYDQMFTTEGLAALERFTGAPVDGGFPDGRLKRSLADREIPVRILDIYSELCRRADYGAEI